MRRHPRQSICTPPRTYGPGGDRDGDCITPAFRRTFRRYHRWFHWVGWFIDQSKAQWNKWKKKVNRLKYNIPTEIFRSTLWKHFSSVVLVCSMSHVLHPTRRKSSGLETSKSSKTSAELAWASSRLVKLLELDTGPTSPELYSGRCRYFHISQQY